MDICPAGAPAFLVTPLLPGVAGSERPVKWTPRLRTEILALDDDDADNSLSLIRAALAFTYTCTAADTTELGRSVMC